MPYNIYPGVDENHKFPPVVRQAIADSPEILSHTASIDNPHSVTKAQVGLGNVDNTSDNNKPLSTAATTALNLKAPLASPTFTGTVGGITKAMVGLGSADNTADTAKPISTAQQTALDLKAPLASPTFTGTVSGITKTHVGLSNVDNTSDVNKPVSTAQSALFVPRWQPTTVYIAGQQVLNPSNDVVSALANFTSGASYNAANWSTPATVGAVAKGLVANVDSTTNSSSSTGQQIISNIPTFTFLANRWYEVEWTTGVVNNTGASSIPLAQLFTCAVADPAAATTGLTEISGWNIISTASLQTVRVVVKRKIKYGSNTTLQIKGSLHGNGQDCYAAGGATWPGQLSITDLGAQF
jgi:hypothetical protein